LAVSIIVAMTRDRVIGNKGTIPWHIREEAEHFRELTTGNTVIMGRNTWESLPEKFRPLPDRLNIIVSTSLGEQKGAIVCKTVSEAVVKAAYAGKGETFCIGGAQLYMAMLPMAEVMHVSWVKGNFAGDAHFPEIDFSQWEQKQTREYEKFTYVKYLRKRPSG